jgi:hypothetical protein
LTASACHFCGEVETQQHINVACQHPPLVEIRMLHRHRIEEFYMNYRHQHILPLHRWVIPLLDYMEDHLWSNTAEGGDVWNGRWTPHILSTLLKEDSHLLINQPDFKGALQWLQGLTLLLQNAQRALYGVRHTELLSKQREMVAATVVSQRRQRTQSRTRTLYQAWKLRYTRPTAPRRRHVPAPPPVTKSPPDPLATRLDALTTKWIQHSRCISRASNTKLACPQPIRQRYKHPKRDEHRTTKLKLRKLQQILRISR